MTDEGRDLFVDRGELLVRADGVLALSPQRVHRVQFRHSHRQPQQPDTEPMRFFQRGGGCMAAIAVEHDRHPPAAILPPHQAQERLEIVGPLPSSCQEQPMGRCQVHAAEHDASRIRPAEHDLRRHAMHRAHRTQRRKQQQVGFIFQQDHAALGQVAKYAPEPAFFMANEKCPFQHWYVKSGHHQRHGKSSAAALQD